VTTAAFVINRTRVRDGAGFRRRCQQAAAARGCEPVFLETTVDDHGLGLTREAVAAGAGLNFAAGGDGTVRACGQALAGTQVPLAILPMGTANLAARALGVPARLAAALATGFGSSERRIDLAVADGMTFAAMAGIGLDAAVVSATPQVLKAGLGWLAYAGAGVMRLPGRGDGFTVRLDEGEPFTIRARSVVAGNAGLLPGGFLLLPAARLDDGLLDVGILAPTGLPGWIRVAHRVVTASHHDDQQLTRLRARRIEITADRELPREVDGEIIAPGHSLTVSLVSRALTVRVPAGAGRSRRPPADRTGLTRYLSGRQRPSRGETLPAGGPGQP
jgi:YegS/Rv2252/BmrU family lipid kinase